MKTRKDHNDLDKPYSVYEVHLGSWKRNAEGKFLTYLELAEDLVNYVKETGFTHVEFMPIMEYPYDPSWGYQITGYFAPTARFGDPQGFMRLVEAFHQAEIGVILDWVPSHFPGDAHGLFNFDGSSAYEHPDPKRGYHPDWKSYIFDYGKNEVRSFLMSNAFGKIDFGAMTTEGATNSTCAESLNESVRLSFTCETANTALYGILETLDAFTPASGQNFYISLTSEQN